MWSTKAMPQPPVRAKVIGRILVFDAVSELALFTAIEHGWAESQVPFPTGPVTMCIVKCPLPVGSG